MHYGESLTVGRKSVNGEAHRMPCLYAAREAIRWSGALVAGVHMT
jgi:hypothetical protein